MEKNLYVDNFNQLDTLERRNEYKRISLHLPQSILNVFFEEIGGKICLKKDITSKEMDVAYNLFNQDVYYAGENLSILKNMISIVSSINDAINPLKKMINLNYDISLVGGSLRDLVMGGYNIKNIKVLISINNLKELKNKISSDSKNIEELLKEDYLYKNDSENQLIHILSKFIHNKMNVTKYYLNKEMNPIDLPLEKYEDYNNNAIGTINVEDNRLNYNVTVFVSEKSVNEYVNTFNFNINKLYLTFNEKNIDKLENLLNFCTNEKLEEVYKEINIKKEFLDDVGNKTFTLKDNNLTQEVVNVLITKSFSEMKDKYKDFNLNNLILDKSLSKEEQVIEF